MADDAAATPSYTNDPSDPSTWSPAFTAQIQAGVAKKAADDAVAAAQIALGILQPASFVLAGSWAQQAAAIKTLAKASEDELLVTWGNNLATVMTGFANEYRSRFTAAGGVLPAS